jgi:lambda repressor-like predicted transcriptional regulator
VFLDIQGASDRTSFYVITEAAEQHWVESTTVRWINTTLESKSITVTLSGETLEVSVTRGCPQGGHVIAPAVQPGCGWASQGA